MFALNLAAAFVLMVGGFVLGTAVCCTYTGMTPDDLHKAAAASARHLWARISRDDSQARVVPTDADPLAPWRQYDDAPAPTLEDLADDAEADPICHAVATGGTFNLHDHPGLSIKQMVQHLEAHGRTYSQAVDQAAALLEVTPRSLEAILGRAWGHRPTTVRPTTDAELATVLAPASTWDVTADGALFTVDDVLAASHVFDNAGQDAMVPGPNVTGSDA